MDASTPPPQLDNLDEFAAQLFEKLIRAARVSQSLPASDEHSFLRSFQPYRTEMESLGQRLLALTERFIQHERGESKDGTPAEIFSPTAEVDEVVERFHEVVDVVDSLIERVDAFVDEPEAEQKGTGKIIKVPENVSSPSTKTGSRYIFHGSNIKRPQLDFPDKVDNSPTPFVPKITEKPNAIKPLEVVLEEARKSTISANMRSHLVDTYGLAADLAGPSTSAYPHPYGPELMAFTPPSAQLLVSPPMPSQPESAPLTWVDTPEALQRMAATLSKATELAVDLENHSYRSYQGFLCLMQLSTRTEDFLVDVLALRAHVQAALNPIFTNPDVLKVFHGADNDIVWLQRDFGVFVVNMFDTYQASRLLDHPHHSLAYLLKYYCNIEADKQYQLADWRIRPLPEEMIKYARSDTHYLLYIYDVMRNELLARGNSLKNLLLAVYQRSVEVCLLTYEKEIVDERSHLALYNRNSLIFNASQMSVFAALYRWRDEVARREDESVRYVLPNHMMFRIAEKIPSNRSSLLALCCPTPPMVHLCADELVALVKTATENPIKIAPQPSISEPLIAPAHRPPVDFMSPPSSPVLSTEDLYRVAGWVETPSVTHSTANSSRPFAHSPTSPMLVTSSDEEVYGDEAHRSTYFDLCSQIEASLTTPLFAGNAPAPSMSPMSTSPHAPAPGVGAKPEAPKPVEAAKATAPVDQKDVPQSMAEIYMLSNANRKRNKQKKKLKAGGTDEDEVAGDSEEGDEDAGTSKTKGGSAAVNTHDTSSFLEEIGWAASGEVSISPPTTAPPPTQRRRSGVKSPLRAVSPKSHGTISPKSHSSMSPTRVVPFDYSSANAAFADPPMQQSSHPVAFSAAGGPSVPSGRGGQGRGNLRPKSGQKTHTFGKGNTQHWRR